ncbi:MAG: SRPBCC family protein [Anaerolineae bacterium]
MAGNDYHFITHWRVEGTLEEVADIISDAPDLARWWPSVYLDVQQLEPGDERGIGKVVSLYTKGWLPYTLRWQFRVTESRYPHGFTLEAWGDFDGRGIWTFAQAGPWVDITFDWKIRADKPLLRYLSFLLKPLFSANHRWAMARGEESLRLELARRQAATPEARARIPPPPGPTTASPLPLLLGIAVLALAGAGWVYLLSM